MIVTVLLVLGADPSRLEAAWADLATNDEARVARATLALAADKDAVKWLAARLRPIKNDPKRVAKLIEQLDAEGFDERREAMDELSYLGKYIKDDLRKAADGKASVEVKARLKELLEKADPPAPVAPGAGGISIVNRNGRITINGVPLEKLAEQSAPPKTPGAWLRAVRATAVLEHVGSPEARAVLEKLTDGEEDAIVTKAARKALFRSAK